MPSSPVIRPSLRRDCDGVRRRFGRWREFVRRAGRKWYAAPSAVRIAVTAATIVAVLAATNLGYHVLRKPTEIFVLVSGKLDKTPAETWTRYAPLFRKFSTAAITPELLAALAQIAPPFSGR